MLRFVIVEMVSDAAHDDLAALLASGVNQPAVAVADEITLIDGVERHGGIRQRTADFGPEDTTTCAVSK
jgi:hypothetical protein